VSGSKTRTLEAFVEEVCKDEGKIAQEAVAAILKEFCVKYQEAQGGLGVILWTATNNKLQRLLFGNMRRTTYIYSILHVCHEEHGSSFVSLISDQHGKNDPLGSPLSTS
jgi:hypothetical protein